MAKNNSLPQQIHCASSGNVELLNQECFCLSLDQKALANTLVAELGTAALSTMVQERCPYLFASQPIFVAAQQIARMGEVVRAVESVVAMPAYREHVLVRAPTVAQSANFHLTNGQLGLIKINTNAGGAMLNAVMARTHRTCRSDLGVMGPMHVQIEEFEQSDLKVFLAAAFAP